jgi:hypothetical protein
MPIATACSVSVSHASRPAERLLIPLFQHDHASKAEKGKIATTKTDVFHHILTS